MSTDWTANGNYLLSQNIDERSTTKKFAIGTEVEAKHATYGVARFAYLGGVASCTVRDWVTINMDDGTVTRLAANAIGPVGIAMATGTDVAIESAGITLLHGDISKLVKAVKLSKMTMTGIKQNLFWAFFYNAVGIPLAGGLFYPIFGWLLSPVFAGFVMALSSVSVVGNSLRRIGTAGS